MSQPNHWLLPEGIEEILPPKAQVLEKLRRELLDLYDSWGYELVIPPLIEYIESLLTGRGSDLDLQTFKLIDQLTGRTLGIRADITPQVARMDAHQICLDEPTRLCYSGWALTARGNELAASRAPLQIGAELYGHAGVESDLEIILLMLKTLDLADISDIYLDLGHVGIFNSLARQANLSERQELDLFEALQRKAIPEIERLLSEFELNAVVKNMLFSLADLSGDDTLTKAREQLMGAGQPVDNALHELDELTEKLKRSKPGISVHYDLAELRGYHYHTGMVYAAFTPGVGKEVARGGRYDDIGRLFGRARPACGFSADLVQLLDIGQREIVPPEITILAPVSDDLALAQRVEELRAAGRRVLHTLPGQQGDAKSLGCNMILRKQGSDWVVEPA